MGRCYRQSQRLDCAMLLRSLLFRWQLCAGPEGGCAQAAVKTTLEVVARNDACYPHFPQVLLRKRKRILFWGCGLFLYGSRGKLDSSYLKYPCCLPKVPTCAYLKYPPEMRSLDDLPKVPTGMRLARPPVPSYPQSECVGLACMTSDGLVWVVTRCAYKRADR